jgi:hypothetical protein
MAIFNFPRFNASPRGLPDAVDDRWDEQRGPEASLRIDTRSFKKEAPLIGPRLTDCPELQGFHRLFKRERSLLQMAVNRFVPRRVLYVGKQYLGVEP